ncbi:MAG: hypothetical protein NXI27_31920 [Alphaproteobacteria bacterium]|nr:hypothetical protein [Alphaproteobacteria bacterium]
MKLDLHRLSKHRKIIGGHRKGTCSANNLGIKIRGQAAIIFFYGKPVDYNAITQEPVATFPKFVSVVGLPICRQIYDPATSGTWRGFEHRSGEIEPGMNHSATTGQAAGHDVNNVGIVGDPIRV